MTVLDKVFIKAYGKSAQPAPPDLSAPSAPWGRRIDAAHTVIAPHANEINPPAIEPPASVAPLATPVQPPDRGRIDARHDAPRPHWPAMKALSTAVPPAPATVAPVEWAAAALPALPKEISKPPAIVPPPAPEPLPEKDPPAQHAGQRAAFEVDRFLWPELCQRLMAAASWSEASRELAAASREGQQVFVIASQQRGEGRSTLALCLAQRLAEKKLRVTLVDADFHRPQLARSLKLLPATTWDEVLRGNLSLTESWIESVEDGVTLLPLKDGADTTGLIGNPRLKELFSLLRRLSDVVLIDAGSLEDFSDREVLALLGGTAQVDGAIIVRDVRKTGVKDLDQAPKCLDALGIARVDVVENFVAK